MLKKESPYLFNPLIVRYSNFIIRNILTDKGMGLRSDIAEPLRGQWCLGFLSAQGHLIIHFTVLGCLSGVSSGKALKA